MWGEAVAFRCFDDAASGGHGGQALVERGGADAAQGAQIGEWLRVTGFGEGGGDALVDRALLGGLAAAARCSTVRVSSSPSRRR